MKPQDYTRLTQEELKLKSRKISWLKNQIIPQIRLPQITQIRNQDNLVNLWLLLESTRHRKEWWG